MSKVDLENWRWDSHSQTLQEKHKMAYSLFKTLPKWTQAKVCDVGCGDSFFLNHIEAGSKFGVDFSQVAVDKSKAKGIEAFKVDIEKESLPFKNKEFDVVFLIDVLEHVWLPEELLKEASRVGKHVILTVPNFSFLKDRLMMLLGQVPQLMGHKKGHCYFMNYKEVRQVCEQASLEVIQLEAYYPLKHKKIIGKISYYIYKTFPNMWATTYGILLRLK